ncbi:MAG: hypothetical protein ACRDSZ_15405 [Pseudonocardiaceae bacterium]
MTDGESTQEAHDSQHETPIVHCVHLLAAERELLAECHRHRVYLALCGVELPVSELAASLCEAGCDRMIGYCLACLDHAAGVNADAGLVWSPPGPLLTVGFPALGGVGR